MEEILTVELRETRGKHHARRLRKSGSVPAVLYGRGGKVVSLTMGRNALQAALRHGSRMVKLAGAEVGMALIQDLQWDAFGMEVQHVDLVRITADQQIRVAVAVELRGDAPGVKQGGILDQVLREVELEVQATSIPDRLHVNVNGLGLDQSITARDIEDLPEGAKLLNDPGTVIVHCVVPAEEAEEVRVSEGAEPELISGKPEEGAAEEQS
jgi:large subunit ribosomal protein L25